MKIYNKLVLDIETGTVFDEDSLEYEGPVSLCKGNTTVAAPAKTATENQIDATQLQLLQQQVKDNEYYRTYMDEMQPFMLESMGYTRDENGKITKTGLTKASDAMQAHQLAISGYGTDGSKLTEDQMLAEMTDTEKRDYELNKVAQERQLKAYKGELDISPALEEELTAQENEAKEVLARKLGSNWMLSTSGQTAMKNLQQKANLVREEARQGLISSGEGILTARENNSIVNNSKNSNLVNTLNGLNADQLNRMLGYGNVWKSSGGNAFEMGNSLSSKYASERANQQNLNMINTTNAANQKATTSNSMISGGTATAAAAAAAAA
ncbi:MAG: hypothetical protein ABFD75_02045 [Smithella sp.]